MNYEARFGTDWTIVTFDEALIRAFALGIAAENNTEPADELDRLRSLADSNYQRNIIEMAYQEGRQFDSYPIVSGEFDALPEFLHQIDVDVDRLARKPQSKFQLDTVPPSLTVTPMHRSSLLDPPMLSPPAILYNRPD